MWLPRRQDDVKGHARGLAAREEARGLAERGGGAGKPHCESTKLELRSVHFCSAFMEKSSCF